MDSYNTPSKETIEKVSREATAAAKPATVENPIKSAPKATPKAKPFTKSANINSTISLLDKIDNFSYQDEPEEVVEEPVKEVQETPVENKKPSIIEQLMASEQARQQNKSNNDIELEIDKPAKKKPVRKYRKNSKSQAAAEANKIKSESILEQFKNLDTESILDELSQENENREQEE